MADIESSIDVDLPVRTVYNQWTQFEDFPMFMEGVEEVSQLTDARLHWIAEIGGQRREWEALIVRQEPDVAVAWASTDGTQNAGAVAFEPLAPDRTRVHLMLRFEPEGLMEKIGDVLGFVRRRAEGDLQRFKEFIEERGRETGQWRGSVGA